MLPSDMRMAMFRTLSGSKRAILFLLVLFLALIVVLPKQSQGILQHMGRPVAEVVALPLQGLAAVTESVQDLWNGYMALHGIHVENQRLRREVEFLRGQNNKLREAAAANDRLTKLLNFKEKSWPEAVSARVIARDSTNWYRGLLLDKGTRDGIQPDAGVVTRGGLVGHIVKVTSSSSVLLLMNDPNAAVTALVQRTRDEGLVTGTPKGVLRMKYVPLLSTVREGDVVVTSGLAGKFPKGLMIGVVKHIEKTEDDLFQSAELAPVVDFSKLEEVLVVTSPPQPKGAPPQSREDR